MSIATSRRSSTTIPRKSPPIGKLKPSPSSSPDGEETREAGEDLEISLADNTITTVQDYVLVPVNVAGCVADLKAYIMKVNTYDLLLGLKWMRRVRMVIDLEKGKVFLRGQDGVSRNRLVKIRYVSW
ncbi:uncharacterized protein N7459_008657 [Penicillium hispanicum]|uniref:uncharacterized protein n=1 Tax=Penicillium hispanicum TaxID=1080232 RepID=UPI0025401CA6|nr:uncharacterized protein N7459_008657 [Penicillium hispanicum]KAJ5574230.1 hypothetical protein N7459_008657 [Penicillium hispanicum]